MDVTLQNHNAKHVIDVPDGLRELCADISREVIRSYPEDIYCFVADYLSTLFVTRENAKVAIKIVQSVTVKSEHVVEILVSTGLELREIAAVAPRLQKAFKVYLNAVDEQKKECGCDVDDDAIDDEQEISICQILRATGASYCNAQRAAIRIQALFRGHRERMSLGESRGEVQWQRAAANTVAILRKTGVTRAEATRAAIIIQAAYRGYYTRKHLRMKREPKKVDMCLWFRMMFEECGITPQRAIQAAIVIQVAYRAYRKRKSSEVVTSGVDSKDTLPLKDDSTLDEQSRDFTIMSARSEIKSVSYIPKASKTEIKSEKKSQSEIIKTESQLKDVKSTAEVIESTEENAPIEEELSEPTEEAEVHSVKEDEDEGKIEDAEVKDDEQAEENKDAEVDERAEENKDAEVEEKSVEEENKDTKVEDDGEEETNKDAENKQPDEETPNEAAEE